MYNRIKSLLSIAVSAALFISVQPASAAPEIFNFVEPAGWTVGSSQSTYQDWARSAATFETLAGTPKVGSNSAGAGLPSSMLSPTNNGFEATDGFYSFMSNYGVSAVIQNHELVSPPAGTGTHVIVQTFAGVNDDPDEGGSAGIAPSVSNVSITGATRLGPQRTYGFTERLTAFSQSQTDVFPFLATIDEFWIPDSTADFTVTGDVLIHSSFIEMRVDTKIAQAVGGISPFAETAVPEPGALALLGLTGGAALLRRRARRA